MEPNIIKSEQMYTLFYEYRLTKSKKPSVPKKKMSRFSHFRPLLNCFALYFVRIRAIFTLYFIKSSTLFALYFIILYLYAQISIITLWHITKGLPFNWIVLSFIK